MTLVPTLEKSAHAILVDHLTNVPTVTQHVIQAAIDEYARVVGVGLPAAIPLRGVHAEVLGQLRQMSECLDIFQNALTSIRQRVVSMHTNINALWETRDDVQRQVSNVPTTGA